MRNTGVGLDARRTVRRSVAQPIRSGFAVNWAVGGAGVHPDWGVNGALRTRRSDDGFAALYVQMPALETGNHFKNSTDALAKAIEPFLERAMSDGC